MFRPCLVVLALVAGAAGCRIEDRTPRGSRRDDEALHYLILQYARRLSERDWHGVRALFWREATYAGAMGPVVLRQFRLAVPVDSALSALARSLDGVPVERYGVWVLRTDLRQEGDLAAAWVIVRRRTPVGDTAVERDWIEHLVFRQIGGEWRLLSVVATRWPRRR